MNKCYVVLEEDRGCGVMVIGVFLNKAAAERVVAEGCQYYMEESEVYSE